MKSTKSKSLRKQYILLYCFAVFIPILIVIFSLFQTNATLKNEVIKTNRTSVAMIQKALDTTLLELDNVIEILHTDPSFSVYELRNNTAVAAEAIRRLSNSYNCLSQIVINIDGSSRLYTGSGWIPSDDIGSQTFFAGLAEAGYTEQEWLSLATGVSDSTFWPTNALHRSPYLYLFSPIENPSNPSGNKTATLVIHQQYIEDLFRSSLSNSKENIILMDSSFRVLSKLNLSISNEDIFSICQHLKENPDMLQKGYGEIKDHDVLFFISQSEETGLYYARILPTQVAYQGINLQGFYTVLVLIFAVLIGVLLITTAIRRSYTPIRSLADWIRGQQDVDENIQNELALFRAALDDALAQKSSMTQMMDISRQGLVDKLLGDLICDSFASEEDFRQACADLNVTLNKPYFAVCTLLIEDETVSYPLPRLLRVIRSELPKEIQLETKDMLLDRKLILVLSSDTNDPEFYAIAMTDMKNRLLEQLNLLTTVGMGAFYDSYRLVGKSYLDSINALDYRMVYGKDCLITPDIYQNDALRPGDSYPSGDLELLESSLCNHREEMASTIIERINANIKQKNYSLHTAKYICYDIFSIVKKNTSSMDASGVHTLPEALNIANITNYDTIDDFFNSVSQLIRAIDGADGENKKVTPANLGNQLLEYADAHCLSYDFQIKAMAESFSITPQYMRKVFKNYTGMSVSEYVSSKRLEKAMYLLTQTEMTLQDIVAQIGNSDISGFVRFFKQRTGMTPGQYRKANASQGRADSHPEN